MNGLFDIFARRIAITASSPRSTLIAPYGGSLVDLVVGPERAAEMKAAAGALASLTLDERALCDLELLAVGGFSPLRTFMGKADYDRVVREQRLADGTLWPLPVVLPVEHGPGVAEGETLALRDVYGNLLAFLHVEEIYEADVRAVEGSRDAASSSVDAHDRNTIHYASGRLEVVRIPPHLDFAELRRTPRALRRHFQTLGWSRIVALHALDPIHRAGEESARIAAERVGGGLLIHPIAGVARPGDVDHYTRIRCFRAMVDEDANAAVLSLLPLAARTAGPRETLLRAIVGRNYGCTELIVGRDHASRRQEASGKPHDEPNAGQEAFLGQAAEIGVGLVDAEPMVFLPDEGRYEALRAVPPGARTVELSEAQVRDEYLSRGIPLPGWFTRPAVAEILRQANPPRFRQGMTIWFTGLSGSGKSTVAQALVGRLAEYGRNCSFLDGDEIRTHLSRGLSFSKEDRDTNIRRVGYVAGLVAQHGGVTLCSVISPYRAIREEARRQSKGNFVEVYCSTPIDVCEQRDVKGLYARARTAAAEGKPMGFTGVDDPYEPPLDPEVSLDTSALDVEQCVDVIIEKLLALGYILPHGHLPS